MATVQKEKDVSEIKLPYKLIPFMRYRFIGFGFSFIVTALCIFSIVTKGFNWGLDFTGGTVIETSFSQPADLEKVRASLEKEGFGSALVNMVHKDIDPQAVIKSVEFVGPNVGEELTQGAIYATLATLGMLLLYVGTRFEVRMAFGGILALFHDVLVTVGIFSFLQIEIDLTFVAAILSVVGYSLNDSIVVFDRVRENFSKIRRVSSQEVIDISLSQTLSRTLMTSITTLFVVAALFWFGGPSIHSFSLALLIGIGFGTYSSIYIAIGVALVLGLDREHMNKPVVEKEGANTESFIDY